MHRALSVALTSMMAFAWPTQAQDSGTIYFNVDVPGQSSFYSVAGEGTNFMAYSVPKGVPSGRSDYPTGRLFLAGQKIGKIPGSPENLDYSYSDIYAHDLAGGSVRVTDFRGPLWVRGGPLVQWSNDNQDTFISFYVNDLSTGLAGTYRAWVSGQDIASPGFVPLTPGDPRLERVSTSISVAWNGDGSRFAYNDSDGIRLHHVAWGPGTANDQLVLSKAATGFEQVGVYAYSPTRDQVVGIGRYTTKRTSTDGIFILNLNVPNQWRWIRSEYPSTKSGPALQYLNIWAPVFSPDGDWVAYNGAYMTKKGDYSALIVSPTNAGENPPETVISTAPPGDRYAGRQPQGWRP